MKTITLHNTNLSVPEIGMGCMRINSLETADAVKEWIEFLRSCRYLCKRTMRRAFWQGSDSFPA